MNGWGEDRRVLDELVETSLKQAALWDQVKDDLHKSALNTFRWSTATTLYPLGHFCEAGYLTHG